MARKLSNLEIGSIGEVIGELSWMTYGKKGMVFKKIVRKLRKKLRKGV